MQAELDAETELKKEFTREFDQVKKRIASVSSIEEEAAIRKRRLEWLTNQLHKQNQRHNKLCLQAFNQLLNIKNKFAQNPRIKDQVNFERLTQIQQEIECDFAPEVL